MYIPKSLCVGVASGLLVAGLSVLSGLPAANAASPLTGRLVDGVAAAHPGVPNMTVKLREVTASGPGTVVATAVTGSNGSFSLDAGSTPDDEYYVQVLAGRYQGGWVGGPAGGQNFVQPTLAFATTYGPHADLGTVWANPAFIRGVVVNAATGNPVSGVFVTARDANDAMAVEGSDTSNTNGVFQVNGITCEDSCWLKLNGSSQGYETGFRACDRTVVATFDDACASPIGRIGKVLLDKS